MAAEQIEIIDLESDSDNESPLRPHVSPLTIPAEQIDIIDLVSIFYYHQIQILYSQGRQYSHQI